VFPACKKRRSIMGLEFLISILVVILVVGIILWAIRYMGLPDPMYKIAVVVAVVVVLLWVISRFGFLV
jgi:hypothetical protein